MSEEIKLNPGVYRNLSEADKKAFLKIRGSIRKIDEMITQCEDFIAGETEDTREAGMRDVLKDARAKKEQLLRSMTALTIRLNFEAEV